MAGAIKTLQFSEGTVVSAPTTPTSRTFAGDITARAMFGTRSDNGRVFTGTRTGGASGALYLDTTAAWIGSITNHPLYFYTNNGNMQMNLTTTGRFGIGATTVDDKLHIEETAADAYVGVKLETASKTTAGAASIFRSFVGATGYGDFGSYHNGSDNAGYFLLRNAGGGTFGYFYMDSSRNLIVSNNAANIGTTLGTVVGTQTSDERLKTDIQPLSYGLSEVKQLQPIRYSMSGKNEIGFGAQTTQNIVPEAVYNTGNRLDIEDENDPGDMLGMEYVRLIPVLTKAVQELAERVEALESTP
jgi:hypothetical protein